MNRTTPTEVILRLIQAVTQRNADGKAALGLTVWMVKWLAAGVAATEAVSLRSAAAALPASLTVSETLSSSSLHK